jgi:hypothetical protein
LSASMSVRSSNARDSRQKSISILNGESYIYGWTSTGADSCSLGAGSGSSSVSISGSNNVVGPGHAWYPSPGSSVSLSLVCTDNQSTASDSVTVTVLPNPLNPTVPDSPMTLTLVSGSGSVLVGQNVTWQCSVSGGTPPYTYSWSGTNIPTSPAPSTNPYTTAYSTVGTKNATLTVQDSGGLQGTCNGSVQVNFNPVFEEF